MTVVGGQPGPWLPSLACATASPPPSGAVQIAIVVKVHDAHRPAPEAPALWSGAATGPWILGVGGAQGAWKLPRPALAAQILRLLYPESRVWYDPDPETGTLRKWVPMEEVARLMERGEGAGGAAAGPVGPVG